MNLLHFLSGNDIFLSYSSTDRRWAVALENLLQLGRYRVFRDDTKLRTGEHLDRLLNEVRRSTMLMVVVTDHSMASDWVHRELQAHLERPRNEWRIAPVFLHPKYPRELPEQFKILADFHGVKLPLATTSPTPTVETLAALERDRALLGDLTSDFRATRRSTLQALAAAILAVLVMALVGFLIWRNQLNGARDAFVKQAELHSAASRFDLAEADLRGAWELERTPAILAAYKEARARRALERPVPLEVSREEGVVAVGELRGKPYAVVHSSNESGGLYLLQNGTRKTLSAKCGTTPMVVTSGAAIVWQCDQQLSAIGGVDEQPRTVRLPATPAKMRMIDHRLELLFREDGVSQAGVFDVPALQPVSIDGVVDAPKSGEMGFCPGTNALLWAMSIEDGLVVARRWAAAATAPAVERFRVRSAEGTGVLRVMWISRVIPASDCGRFFVEYAPFTREKQSAFEMVRIRLNSPRPVDRFDSAIEVLASAPDESGLEAVYLNASQELRAFLLTSPIVLTTRVQTLASNIQRMAAWPLGEREQWTLAVDRQMLSIFRNEKLWSRYASDVGDPVRVVPSTDGKWVVVEGDTRTLLWRRAQPWDGTEAQLLR